MRFVQPNLESLLYARPRALNALHRLRLASPTSQTASDELSALERYATGARVAVEIGTYQGVSAVRIARVLAPGGILHCLDPWPETNGEINPCFAICMRHFQRSGLRDRIRIIRAYSQDAKYLIPRQLDFAFIDGDHTREGINTDWRIIAARIRPHGVVCLHDSVVPAGEDWRHLDSCDYFEKVIRQDPRFHLREIVSSLAVLEAE